MDRMQATPRRYPAVGGLADFLAAGTSPQRTQQMRGLMEFLQVPDIAATLDRVSYGEPLTTGAGMTTKLRPEAENTLMAALGMIPAGKPAEAGAMALGRAGERVAERVVPQVMSRGGLPAEMLSAMAQGTQSPATVFHGTPHLFNKFDSSKIGTGEGNQTYGYGLYLAENPEVAQSYKQALSEPELFLKGRQVATQAGTPMDTAKAWLQDVYDRGFFSSNTANPFDQAIKDVQAAPVPKKDDVIAALNKMKQKNVSMKPSGNLMQVDLPDEQIAKMLDFDKPLSEQSEFVRKAIQENELDYVPDRFTGGRLLEELHKGFAPDVAAKHLRDAGIPGIRYLDQNSRAVPNITNKRLADLYAKHGGNADAAVDEMMRSVYNTPKQKEAMREQFMKQLQNVPKKTSNFVVFPGMEDMLRIEQINNQPVESLLQSLPDAAIRRFDDGGVEVGRQRGDSKLLVTVAPQGKNDRMLSASLENIGGYPTGTGDATMAYVDALESVIKDARGRSVYWDGFTSEVFQSDEARAIYDRLKAAGIPFEKNVFEGRNKNALSLTQEQLFNIDFDKVRRNLTQAADKKKNSSLLQQLGR